MDVLPGLAFGLFGIDVFELEFDVGAPSNLRLLDLDLSFFITPQLEGVIEEALGDKTARDGRQIRIKLLFFLTGSSQPVHVILLLGPQLAHIDYGLAVLQRVGFLILTEQLGIVTRLHISSVVLIEIVELIVDVDGLFDDVCSLRVTFDEWHIAENIILQMLLAIFDVVVLHGDFVDVVREHVEDDAGGEEQEAERQEREHGAHGGGHGPPCRQCLLLELGLLQFLDAVSNVTLIFLVNIHC